MKKIVFIETNFSGLDAIFYCKQNGYHSVLVTDNLKRFEKWFPQSSLTKLNAVTQVVQVSNSNCFDEVKKAIEEQVGHVDAIMTFAEIRTHIAASLAKHFQVKGTSIEAIEIAQNKFKLREVLNQKGVDSVFCTVLPRIKNLEQIAEKLTYPCFIKPQYGHSSIGSVICQSRSEINKIIENLSNLSSEGISSSFIVEEYLAGPLVSVELLTLSAGKHQVLGISDRDVMAESVEIGASFPLKTEQSESILSLAKNALDAIGFDFGSSHVEMILTSNGPHLVEVNTRMGGSGHSVMLEAALGRSVTGDCVELCLGNPKLENLLYKPEKGAAWHCYVSTEAGIIETLPRPEEILSLPGVKEVWFHKSLGSTLAEVNSNFSWVLQVLCTGNDALDAKTRAIQAIKYAESRISIKEPVLLSG